MAKFKPSKFTVVGEDDGRPIVAGLFTFHDRHGLHLADATVALLKQNILPCFHSFARDALASGWKPGTIQAAFTETFQFVRDAGLLHVLKRRKVCD